MSSYLQEIEIEIQKLKLKIVDLEKQIKENREKDENNKKISVEQNFYVINEFLDEKKRACIKYSNQLQQIEIERQFDNRPVISEHLEAIYNILQIVDKRLIKIEEKNGEGVVDKNA